MNSHQPFSRQAKAVLPAFNPNPAASPPAESVPEMPPTAEPAPVTRSEQPPRHRFFQAFRKFLRRAS